MNAVLQDSIYSNSEVLQTRPENERTGINDLKELIKKKIFSNFKRNELQILRAVCRNWFYLINHSFGIKAVINNTSSELIQNSPWIIDSTLHNLTRPVMGNEISFSKRLKHLTMKGMVVSYVFIPFLQECTNLQTLNFVEPTIDLPEAVIKDLMPKNINLMQLDKLGFESWSFSENLETIIQLLTFVKFSNVKEIAVRCVHPPILPLATIFTPDSPLNKSIGLIQLVIENQHSLETFSIGTLIAQNVLKFKVNTYSDDGTPQLEELHAQNLYIAWTPILNSQFNLTVLEINHCQAQQWTDLRTCITRCTQYLRFIKLSGRTFGIPFDCDVFNECIILNELHLNLTLSPKRRLQQLSNSIKVLSIDGPIEKSEMEHLQELKELRKLKFDSLGINQLLFGGVEDNENQDMIDLRLFLMFVQNLPLLENLVFKDCSQDSLDWRGVNTWCRKASSKNPDLKFDQYYYDIRGQRIQHGLELKIPSNFKREEIVIPEPGTSRGILRAVLNLFGF